MNRKVVITGIGVIAPNGIGINEFWQNTLDGKSGVRPYEWGKDFGFNSTVSGQVIGFEAADSDPDDPAAMRSRYVQFALSAAEMAINDSGLVLSAYDPLRVGVTISSAIANAAEMEQNLLTLSEDGRICEQNVRPDFYDSFDFALAASAIARKHGFAGGVSTLSTGCTAGLDALGHALSQIRTGKADIMIAGASEAPLCPLSIGSFEALGALSSRKAPPQEASCPYTQERDGFIIAEGCGVFVLESYESAIKRGAHIYAELAGYSSVNNCYHMTDLAPDGAELANCIKLALDDSDCTPDMIGHISAHGSSTRQNDVNETNAIKSVFQANANQIAINSLKSMTGHSLAAANAVETVALCLEMKHQKVHPTINHRIADPECDLDYVPNQARDAHFNAAMKLSSGFSGIHSVIVLKAV